MIVIFTRNGAGFWEDGKIPLNDLMKASLVLGLMFLLTPMFSRAEEEADLWPGIRKAEVGLQDAYKAYHKSLGDAFADATHIEVFLLDWQPVKVPEGVTNDTDEFWKTHMDQGGGKAVKILQSKKLTPEEIKLLMPGFQETLDPKREGQSYLCFDPIHGIRVYDDEEIVFQMSVCYRCGLYFCIYPLEKLGGGDLTSPLFQETMTLLMPIPEKEKKEEGK